MKYRIIKDGKLYKGQMFVGKRKGKWKDMEISENITDVESYIRGLKNEKRKPVELIMEFEF